MSESFNPHLQKLIFEVVENQIRDNNPPETKATWDRLKAAGYTDLQIKKNMLLALCIMRTFFVICSSVAVTSVYKQVAFNAYSFHSGKTQFSTSISPGNMDPLKVDD